MYVEQVTKNILVLNLHKFYLFSKNFFFTNIFREFIITKVWIPLQTDFWNMFFRDFVSTCGRFIKQQKQQKFGRWQHVRRLFSNNNQPISYLRIILGQKPQSTTYSFFISLPEVWVTSGTTVSHQTVDYCRYGQATPVHRQNRFYCTIYGAIGTGSHQMIHSVPHYLPPTIIFFTPTSFGRCKIFSRFSSANTKLVFCPQIE